MLTDTRRQLSRAASQHILRAGPPLSQGRQLEDCAALRNYPYDSLFLTTVSFLQRNYPSDGFFSSTYSLTARVGQMFSWPFNMTLSPSFRSPHFSTRSLPVRPVSTPSSSAFPSTILYTNGFPSLRNIAVRGREMTPFLDSTSMTRIPSDRRKASKWAAHRL